MKKIYNIIDSELIVRTGNSKFRQEYGEVGVDDNIYIQGANTVFVTSFGITDIMYVTLNGLNLIEGKHYTKLGDNKISIGYGGAALKSVPENTILVGYHHNSVNYSSSVGVPPTVDMFKVSPEKGKDGVVTLDFSINAQEGRNIYWSILADGNANPIYSGSTLASSNGMYENDAGMMVPLEYIVSGPYFIANKGTTLPFTMVVTYDLLEGINPDEKVLAHADYFMGGDSLLGVVNATPPNIASIGDKDLVVSYEVLTNGYTPEYFTWELTKELRGGLPVVIASGDQTNALGTYTETIAVLEGDNYSLLYKLNITVAGADCCTLLASDDIMIYVPIEITDMGRAGYLDAAIMSYVDLTLTRRKIGSLGTPQDAIEYQNRVPRDIFTKDVSHTIVNEEDYVEAPVNTYGDTVEYVYFVMEVPDSWGPITLHQMLGDMNPDAFNVIPLGNGYTAYLYADAPSIVTHPSDYHIKN